MDDITYKKVLSSPVQTVPSLSEKDLRRILVEAVLDYLDKAIDLSELIQVTSAIEKNEDSRLSDESKQILHKLSTLSTYAADEENNKGEIYAIVTNVLDSIVSR